MKFGLGVPTRGPLARPAALAKLAAKAEALGFGYLSFADHIVIPRTISPNYPYSPSGEPPFPADGECLEQLTMMSYVAGITSKVRLLTSVMVVPHRSPVHTAKTIATLDVLSGGRVTVGCGAGWMEEEFEAIGTPPFKERGKVTDEYLAIFRELWTKESPSFQGKYASFSNVKFEPKPVQTPHPPLWIGGESPAAMRRAARLGDGWFPIGANPKFPLDTVDRYGAALSRLKQGIAEAGRPAAEVKLGFWANWSYTEARKNVDGGRHIMSDGAAGALEDIGRMTALGVETFMFQLANPNEVNATLDNMDRFAETVMSKA
jgi:probable F420-dependent oxidoreductase